MTVLARFDVFDLPDRWREELIDWLRTLDVTPEDVAPKAAITRDDDDDGSSSYQLHLSRYLAGRPVDIAACNTVIVPCMLALGSHPKWPDWLATWVHASETPDRTDSH